jgi:NAD(P)H dehydrogenase (quinone)
LDFSISEVALIATGRDASTMAVRSVSVAVVHDSGSRGHPALAGRTHVVAEAIAAGVTSTPGAEAALVRVGDDAPPWDLLDSADAIVLGCPTYMGSASAALKAFMEESFRPQWTEQRWKDKLAAGFTNSAGMSGDKLATLQQLCDFATQHGMLWVSLGEPPGWQDSTGTADDINRLASFLGLMTQSWSDRGPNATPPEADLATARRFGARIANLTHRWARGRAANESIAIVLDAFDAVERGDDARQLELYHPEVEFHWPGSLPYGGTGRLTQRTHRSGWEEAWRPLQPTMAERQLSPRVVAASDDEVVVLWHQRGRSPDGERFDEEVLGLYSIRDGKFARAKMFYFDSASTARFLSRWSPSRERKPP